MANGKIIYPPMATRAVELDGAQSLSLNPAPAFNFGTADFCIDGLVNLSAGTAWPSLARKIIVGPGSGFGFAFDLTNRLLGLTIADASGSLSIYSNASAFSLSAWFWAACRVDRSGLATFFVNGVPAGSGSVAAKALTIDNSEPLKIGNLITGSVGFVRMDVGRVLPDQWFVEEWDRIRYGLPVAIGDFPALWRFGNSLADDSEERYTLVLSGGDLVYGAGWPSADGPVTYQFEENFELGHEAGRLDSRDKQRALNKSSFSYDSGPSKKTFRLPFKNIPPKQAMVFEALWEGRLPFWFYPNADKPAAGQFVLKAPPLFKSVFTDRVDADLDMEEA